MVWNLWFSMLAALENSASPCPIVQGLTGLGEPCPGVFLKPPGLCTLQPALRTVTSPYQVVRGPRCCYGGLSRVPILSPRKGCWLEQAVSGHRHGLTLGVGTAIHFHRGSWHWEWYGALRPYRDLGSLLPAAQRCAFLAPPIPLPHHNPFESWRLCTHGLSLE